MKKTMADKAKMIFLLLYFLILTAERLISLGAIFTGDFSRFDGLDWYMTILTILSLIGAYLFIFLRCRSASSPAELFGRLSVAAGIILLGGMVHTHGSIPPLQFVSYGMILISMAIHTAVQIKEHGGGVLRWLSFSYIVAFSMAIPVVYPTSIELSWLFIPLEIVVSAGMVALFTIMLRGFYMGTGAYGFHPAPLIAAVIGDSAVIALRFSEEINYFVLIFISIAVILFIAGRFAARKG